MSAKYLAILRSKNARNKQEKGEKELVRHACQQVSMIDRFVIVEK